MKVPIPYPKYCKFTSQVCTTSWVEGSIGISEECIYGVLVSVHLSVCVYVDKAPKHIFGFKGM